jgi:beta-1,2-mannobiose phosphorylase / 1,2-beta-oligomannan phosphorylase
MRRQLDIVGFTQNCSGPLDAIKLGSSSMADTRELITRRAFLYFGASAACCSAVPVYMKWKGLLPLSNGQLNRKLLAHTVMIRRTFNHKTAGTRSGWRKYASNPMLGGALGTCFDVSVLKEEDRYRMWFSWRPLRSIALSESCEGLFWSAPRIVLRPACDWELDVNRPAVIRKGDTYEMWYTGQTKEHSYVGHARSHDGVGWRRTTTEPVLVPDRAWENASLMCPHVIWDTATREYRMWYSGGEQFEPNAIGYATSPDGDNWAKHCEPIFTHGAAGDFDQDRVAGAYVLQQGGWHLMFYAGFKDEMDAAIGLARSRDGITAWERHPANPIIGPGPHFSDWDFDSVYKASVVVGDGRWMLWFNGRRGAVEQIGLAVHDGLDLGFQER